MPVVKKYKSEVVSVLNPTENIFAVEFSPIENRFRYMPGQFLHLALDEYNPSEVWPESRCFSMQTSPTNETLKITFSVKGDFTKLMAEKLKPGSQVWLKLPYGELFSQGHDKQGVVFIAGGTGITPFLSLFTDPSFAGYLNPKLYLGFRSRIFDIYNEELAIAKKYSSSLLVVKFFEDQEGVVDIEKIYHENGLNATYFISGPPAMIKTFSFYLKQKGVAESKVITDDWE